MHETRFSTHEPTTSIPTSLRLFIPITPTTSSLYSSSRSGQAGAGVKSSFLVFAVRFAHLRRNLPPASRAYGGIIDSACRACRASRGLSSHSRNYSFLRRPLRSEFEGAGYRLLVPSSWANCCAAIGGRREGARTHQETRSVSYRISKTLHWLSSTSEWRQSGSRHRSARLQPDTWRSMEARLMPEPPAS